MDIVPCRGRVRLMFYAQKTKNLFKKEGNYYEKVDKLAFGNLDAFDGVCRL